MLTEQEFADKINSAGGRAFIVGGYVRDQLMGRQAKDKDYVVCHITKEKFVELFPEAKLVGQSFPVYLVDIFDKHCEVSFGRKERKAGIGYRGFDVKFDDSITIEEDLARRDTTMNALAMDLKTGEVIDLFGGREDIQKGIVRAISECFKEDPVRALRAARQAAQLGFDVDDNTLRLMGECREELLLEPNERIFKEMSKALEAPRPSVFFRILEKADLLKDIFPEIHALIGKTQPVEFHPEGDSFEHVMDIVDKVAAKTDNIIARFAGLAHDLGKGRTPMDMLPHHYGHEVKGLDVLRDWNKRMTIPKGWLKAANFVIKEHMRAPIIKKEGKIVDLLLATRSIERELPYADFKEIIRADHNTLPNYLEQGEDIIKLMLTVSGNDAPEHIKGKAIGEWVHRQQLSMFYQWETISRLKGE
ncbi:MAG: HD domain-containing protein [Selenomonadaceae bacterium]|nr:HD domain-containing protein [Selenomonadaceae bacterium]